MPRTLPHGTLLLLACSAPAQSVLLDELSPKAHLPADARANEAIVSGDFDGDGLVDLVLGRRLDVFNATSNRVLFGDGAGAFYRTTNLGPCPGACELTRQIVAGDLDDDGDLDVVTVNQGPARVWLNDGSGSFALAGHAFSSAPSNGCDGELGDVDGDGDLDFLWTRDPFPELRLYLNDGAGVFSFAGTLPSAIGFGSINTHLVDLDGDLDLDVLATGPAPSLLLNDGSGVFVDATATHWLVPAGFEARGVVGDVDGDGDVDAVLGSNDDTRLIRNDGLGRFSWDVGAIPPTSGADRWSSFADTDGDGDLDLYAAASGRLLTNDGAGVYTFATQQLPSLLGEFGPGHFADVDSDGAMDLVLAESSRLWVNDGHGRFMLGNVWAIPGVRSEITPSAALDADRDGDLDVITRGRLMLNNGLGRFEPGFEFGWTPGGAVETADVNGDGLRDVLTRIGTRTRLFVATPVGSYRDETSARLPDFVSDFLLLEDFDGDGDTDIVAREGVQSSILINDGGGFFSDESAARLPTSTAYALDCGDVDGDGDFDLISVAELWVNDGAGVFDVAVGAMPTPLPSAPSWAYSGWAGDLDGDGFPDLVAGQTCCLRQSVIYLNDGTGSFQDVSDRLIDDFRGPPVALVDLDTDRRLDVVFWGSTPDQPVHALRNHGNATFSDVSDQVRAVVGSTFADLDGDGDLDSVGGAARGGVVHNATRHLQAPFLARTGRTYTLRLFSNAVALGQVLLAIGSPAAPIATPFGVLRLELPTTVPLPQIAVLSGGDPSDLRFTIPADAALVDVEFHAQAIIATETELRLTNAIHDRIVD